MSIFNINHKVGIIVFLLFVVLIEDASASNRGICCSILSLCSYVTPERYGAKGDGTSDDTEAFLKAIGSGKKVKCKNIYRLRKSSLPVTRDGKPCYPTINNLVRICGGGRILYDFHINVAASLDVMDVSLKSTGLEPNGLFSILEGGQASFSNVRFDGSAVDRVNGGVASRGELVVKDCEFFQSDINIIAPNGGFIISGSSFDANYANDSRHLSNELIHIQQCASGIIMGCSFIHSKQDIIDFYFGAKNVCLEKNVATDNESTLFEIKAEYRDIISAQGGNQVYDDHTESITIKNNVFIVSHSVAWIGTRSDVRVDRSKENGYYVRNVKIEDNTIEVNGNEKIDLFFIRNVKGLSIKNNKVTSQTAPLFFVRVMPCEAYETCEEIEFANNHFACPSYVGCYIEGNLSDMFFSSNILTHSSSESYLLLQKDSTNEIGVVSVISNVVNSGPQLRIGTFDRPISCRVMHLNDQSASFTYLGSTNELIICNNDEQTINLTGCIGMLKVEKCRHPLFISDGAEISQLLIADCDFRETPSFVSKGKTTTVKKYSITRTKFNKLFDKTIRTNE